MANIISVQCASGSTHVSSLLCLSTQTTHKHVLSLLKSIPFCSFWKWGSAKNRDYFYTSIRWLIVTFRFEILCILRPVFDRTLYNAKWLCLCGSLSPREDSRNRVVRKGEMYSRSVCKWFVVAVHIPTNIEVAIKILSKEKIKQLEMSEKVKREIQILRSFKHPHIVRL